MYGATAVIEVLDESQMRYVPYTFMIDTLSSASWLVNRYCSSSSVQSFKKLSPTKQLEGETTLEFNTGNIKGNFYNTTLNLRSCILGNQPILLLNEVDIKEFKVNYLFLNIGRKI
jgi:hypothetical protein